MFDFTRSPITHAEHQHQRLAMSLLPANRGWRRWLVLIAYLIALEIAMIVFWGEFAGALTQRAASPIINWLGVAVLYMAIVAASAHLIIMLRVLALAAESVTRERRGDTWELLRLTSVDARQLVRGKWWAALRTMRRNLLLIVPLRAGLIVLLGASSSHVLSYMVFYSSYQVIFPHPLAFLLAALILIPMTLLAGALTAACGVLASLLSGRVSAVAGGLAMLLAGLTLGIPIVSAIPFNALGNSICYRSDTETQLCHLVRSATVAFQTTQLDNGTFVLAGSTAYRYEYITSGYDYRDYSTSDGVGIALGFGVSMIVTVLLTWLVLRIAEWVAVRQGVSPRRR